MKLLLFFMAASAGLIVVSCSDDGMEDVFQMMPGDGATNVLRDAEIALSFDRAVDSAIVAANFHLMPETDMDAMMDSVNTMEMSYDDMLAMMGRHAMAGRFEWSDGYTRCTFDPDSMMAPQTGYSVHMGQPMMDTAGMHHSSSMMDMPAMMSGDMMITFRTGN